VASYITRTRIRNETVCYDLLSSSTVMQLVYQNSQWYWFSVQVMRVDIVRSILMNEKSVKMIS